MITINEIFSNSLSHATRQELIQYLSDQLTNKQIKKILENLTENTKTEILEERFKEKIGNLVSMMASVGEKVMELKEEQMKEQDLQKLEGRILLLKLIQKMSTDKGDEKLLAETNDNLSTLFTEYRMQGGEKFYHTFDVKKPRTLTESFLLNKYWTSEILNTYKKMNANSFIKWNIPKEEAKFYLGKINFAELEKSPEKKRFYFFGNFFVSKLIRYGANVYGIGTDSERKEFPDKIVRYPVRKTN